MGCLAPGLGGLPPGAGGAGGGHGLDDSVAQRQGGAHAGPGEQRGGWTLLQLKDLSNIKYNSGTWHISMFVMVMNAVNIVKLFVDFRPSEWRWLGCESFC